MTTQIQNGLRQRRLLVFLHAVLFVLGFSLVFIVGWGGAATLLGQLFTSYKAILGRLGGVVVIIFGLATIGVLKIPWFFYDTRPDWQSRKGGLLSSGMMGVFFAAGWSPCIGATLGTILTLGFSQETAGLSMLLSSGYALGLGIPFLLIGLGINWAAQALTRIRRYMRSIQIGSGVLMILIGLLMVTNQITLIAIWGQRNGFFLDLPVGGAAVPSYFLAVAAGLLSFLSPCVLPLVPAYIGYLTSHAVGGQTGE